jgi:hypothetical protein
LALVSIDLGTPKAFPADVDTGSAQEMRPNQDAPPKQPPAALDRWSHSYTVAVHCAQARSRSTDPPALLHDGGDGVLGLAQPVSLHLQLLLVLGPVRGFASSRAKVREPRKPHKS